jgi:hypothetical protein
MSQMSELTKDPLWQKVRGSLSGRWNLTPDWCCTQLRNYLGEISNTEESKLRIVMNYLTSSGFRMGKINHPCISALRGQVSAELKKRKFQEV